jgi:nucleoside-diphosphate-sugar epimerase
MNDLVRTFEKVVGFKIITNHVDKTENDPMLRRPDINVANRVLGFYPRVKLEDGIHKTILHFAENT